MFWLFGICSTEEQEAGDAVLLNDEYQIQVEEEEEEYDNFDVDDEGMKKNRNIGMSRSGGEFSHLSAPSDERNASSPRRMKNSPSPKAELKASTQPQNNNGSTNQSDEDTPEAVEPVPLAATFSALFGTECVRECADPGDPDEDDSFVAVFDNPHFRVLNQQQLDDPNNNQQKKDVQAAAGSLEDLRQARTMKGMTICVHSPRLRLPEKGYETQWEVDPPLFTGIYRLQVSILRDRFNTQYPCSETGEPIEVHQEGERLEVARLTCYRFRPKILRQQWNPSWPQKYPSVARFLDAVPEDPEILVVKHEAYQRHMIHSVSQVLLEDLYVHPDYRGGGLGLSLLDYASRKVGDALACTIIGLPSSSSHTPRRPPSPHDEQDEAELHHDDDRPPPQETTLQDYFGLLGYVPIHERYMARPMAHVMLEEACPLAPNLDPSHQDT